MNNREPKGSTRELRKASLVIDLERNQVVKNRLDSKIVFTEDGFLFVMDVRYDH